MEALLSKDPLYIFIIVGSAELPPLQLRHYPSKVVWTVLAFGENDFSIALMVNKVGYATWNIYAILHTNKCIMAHTCVQ